MSVKALWQSILKVTEKGAKPASGRSPVYIHQIDTPKLAATLNEISTPAISKVSSGSISLAGITTVAIDLTAAPHPSGVPVDFTGLRLRRVEFRNRSTSNERVLIFQHNAWGYPFGTLYDLSPGDSLNRAYNTALSVVSATAKNIGLQLDTSGGVGIVDFVIVGG